MIWWQNYSVIGIGQKLCIMIGILIWVRVSMKSIGCQVEVE